VVALPVPAHGGGRARAQSQVAHAADPGRPARRLTAVGDAEGVAPAQAVTALQQPRPLRRASFAWLAVKVSPALESFAFLARGLELGAPPVEAGCAQHELGPLLAVVLGPVAGTPPPDATEQLYRRAADARGVTLEQWQRWCESRRTPELLEDVTALLHTGSCAERPGLISCTCGPTGVGTHRRLRAMPPGGGPIPTLTPDPSAETDPWHDALVDFVARFRGRGTSRRSQFNHESDTSVRDRRQLMSHLELLASTFAGPRRIDRMAGLASVDWTPRIRATRAWQRRDRATGTESAREELLARLVGVIK